MDVSEMNDPLVSDYYFRPFYAWTCVDHGRAIWLSDTVLHFHSYGAGQGRVFSTYIQNTTEKTIPYTEVWVRSIDVQGFSHSPSIFLLFDIRAGERRLISPGPQIFAGGEYFLVGCEQDRMQTATSRFKIPTAGKTAPYIPLSGHRITVKLSHDGPSIQGNGGFEPLSAREADALVPDVVRLPLSEERQDPRKKQTQDVESQGDDSAHDAARAD